MSKRQPNQVYSDSVERNKQSKKVQLNFPDCIKISTQRDRNVSGNESKFSELSLGAYIQTKNSSFKIIHHLAIGR